MSPYSTHIWVTVVIGAFIVIGGFTAFARWSRYSPAARRSKLDVMRVGMTAPEILALLGAPRQKKMGEKEEEFWVYGSRCKRHVLVLEFNRSGTLCEFVHGVPRPGRAAKPVGE